MARIFLSYRRSDAPRARRLHEELATRFGDSNVFMDIDRIEPGFDFAEAINSAIGAADVFLAVIGPSWFEVEHGERWIDNPNQFVRLEIAAALDRGTRVIPVLVGGAQMPVEEDLPTELRPLARRAALELRDASWPADLDRLVGALESIESRVRGVPEAAPPGRRRSSARRSKPPPSKPRKKPTSAPASPLGQLQLNTMLRDAALAGVVSEDVANSLPGGTVSRRPPGGSPPSPTESVPPPKELRDRRGARGYSGGGLGLGWVAVALLGAGFVVAKWLLGWFVESGPPVERDKPVRAAGDVVACTIFAPPSVRPGDTILVQAFAHLPEDAGEAADTAMVFDSEAVMRTFQSLELPVSFNARLDFELRLPSGFEVDDPVASLIWRRVPAGVQFGVRVPKSVSERTVIGTLHIRLDAVPVGRIKFKLKIDGSADRVPSEPQGEHAHRYTVAFISYASTDRAQVLPIVRGLSVAGVRYFQDVLSLEPGDRWEQKLKLGIDECDLFMLFWSSEAKKSKWVRREVRYALDRQAGDELAPPDITPIPIEDPPPRPWRELKHLHNNDPLLYFLRPPSAP